MTGNTETYLLLNRSGSPAEISVYIGEDKRIRDPCEHEEPEPFDDGCFRATVAPHDVVMVKGLSR